MKVLHVVPSYAPAWEQGGVVRSVSTLCRHLVKRGVELEVFTTDSAETRRLDVKPNLLTHVSGVPVTYFRTNWSLKFCYSTSLTEALRRRLPDFNVLHITSVWCYPGIIAAYYARQYNVPYIESPRGCLVPHSLSYSRVRKKLLWHAIEKVNFQRAAAIHYTTSLEREQSRHLHLSVPSFVVPNALELEEFAKLPNKVAARRKLGLPEAGLVVGFLGRLHTRKALDYLIRAFSRVVNALGEVYLVLVGPDDGIEAELRRLVERLNLRERVLFTGFIAPAERGFIFSAANVMTLITHPGENFGNAAIEAMAAGVPVIVSDNVGVCREVKADRAGAVVPVQEEAIAGELVKMLSDPAALQRMGRAAYLSARTHYSIEVAVERMATAYEDILTGQRSPECQWLNTVD